MKQLTRVRSRSLVICLVAFGITLAGKSAGAAQENRPAPRSFVNKAAANLPINLDERARPQIKEVQLYVKDNPQSPWMLKDKVPPTQPFFHFKAPQDGEYYFCVVTVDRQGRSVPPDVTLEPPGLIVVFDTQPPQVEVQALVPTAEGQEVHCEIRDANPDPAKTRFYFQTRDQLWRPLEAVPGNANLFRIPAQAVLTGMVRVTASDQAGNMVTREFDIANPKSVVAAAPLAAPPAVVPAVMEGKAEKVQPCQASDGDKLKTTDRPFAERVEVVVTKAMPPNRLPLETQSAPAIPEVHPASDKNVVQVAAEQAKPQFLTKRHLVNSTHVFLDYQIEQTGASGVGRVEVWCTRDMGKTWQKLGEDTRRKSPAEIELPGEGLFGLSMLVCNGRGFSANPPSSGDAPDMWIEVDTTRPTAELTGAQVAEDGSFIVAWRAADQNMADDPIDLYFAASREGPWRPIAKGLKNDGQYRWSPGPEAGAQAYLRMVVRDMAGNVAVSESLQPIMLDDLSRPRGRLLGISITRPGTPPNGN